MPASLKQVKQGPEPESVKHLKKYLEKNVTPEAPYFSQRELLEKLKITHSTLQKQMNHLESWRKRVGALMWWSTPEHIKKL